VLEQIVDSIPELRDLDSTVRTLEEDHAKAVAKVQALLQKVGEAKESDITREAEALNAGRRPPPKSAPKLEEQLRDADYEVSVYQRRLQLATADRGTYIREHLPELLGKLKEAHGEEAGKLSRSATGALRHLGGVHKAEDDARELQRMFPAPVEENTSEAASLTTISTISPVQSTANIQPGRRRGELEQTLQFLIGCGMPEEAVVGPTPDEAESKDGAA
jgi:hypothetical protein